MTSPTELSMNSSASTSVGRVSAVNVPSVSPPFPLVRAHRRRATFCTVGVTASS